MHPIVITHQYVRALFDNDTIRRNSNRAGQPSPTIRFNCKNYNYRSDMPTDDTLQTAARKLLRRQNYRTQVANITNS